MPVMRAVRMFLVPHTHWDREWYLPFEAFRDKLVAMMDGLIELLDRDPRFAHFHLDGQTAMIDDYLEVRPEREADIRRLARDGRISVGPWFTQMDEFLVSGESLIRNLEWGLARARDLAGEARMPRAGYLPDQFGHVGQMPQILRGHGIEHAVLWRGVPAAIDRTTFRWESPDGSSVLAEYLPFGYSVGASLSACRDAGELETALDQAVALLEPMSVRDRLLVTVGSDHHVPPAGLAPLLDEVGRENGVEAEIGSIAGFLDGSDPEGVPSWRGELRSAARAHLLPNVYSNRVQQKQQRARVETMLERVAEPLAALVPGFEWPEEELREAWRLLLWNGAHDSVCGCSVDEVARTVDERYDRAESLAQGIVDRAVSLLAGRMSSKGPVGFNPSPFEDRGIPGLGWTVYSDPRAATAAGRVPWVEITVDGDWFSAGGFEFRVVDEGDIGDLYTFCPTGEQPAIPPETMKFEDRSVRTNSGLDDDFRLLKATWSGLEVTTQALPGRQEGSVRLFGSIANSRPDHRLRLHVRLDESANGSFALSPFEVVERPLISEGGTETPSPTWPARGAVIAGGVAVFTEGVFEYEVLRNAPELAITLLRCVGTISRPQIVTRGWAAGPDIPTPDAQMIGENYFSFSFLRGVRGDELPSTWERLELLGASADGPGGGDLRDSGSLLEVQGAELSSVRKVDGVVEVRIWNPCDEAREARVAGRAIRLGPGRIETIRLD